MAAVCKLERGREMQRTDGLERAAPIWEVLSNTVRARVGTEAS